MEPTVDVQLLHITQELDRFWDKDGTEEVNLQVFNIDERDLEPKDEEVDESE